jgi:hypothetical protein
MAKPHLGKQSKIFKKVAKIANDCKKVLFFHRNRYFDLQKVTDKFIISGNPLMKQNKYTIQVK